MIALLYHHIGSSLKDNIHYVAPEDFGIQMAYLFHHKYKIISENELIEFVKKRTPLPLRSVLLTFDDGYEDNYSQVLPVLEKFGFKAMIFISPNLINKKGYLTYKMIKETNKKCFFYGTHTFTHAHLPNLSRNEAKREILESKTILEEKLNSKINFFAYPYGAYNQMIRELVKENGYLGALTMHRGINTFRVDPFSLKRMMIKGSDNRHRFVYKLTILPLIIEFAKFFTKRK